MPTNVRNSRSALAADFAFTNPYLGDGEERYETDTGKSKIGPGYWNSLPYGAGQDSAGSGASGLSPAQPSTPGTSHNYESGTGDYTVNVIGAPRSAYAFGFQRDGDAFPFLAVTAVGDWVISDGTYDPTNHPVSFIGMQRTGGGGLIIKGGGSSGIGFSVDGVQLGAVVTAELLPTADPAVAGQLWNDAGTVKVSAG